ncbi:MAG: hypothetical protein Q7T19_15275 [Caulobacter sp.]|nr:hypothetical protein [Caulobacter sp.]
MLWLAMFVALTACDAGGWRVEVTGPRVGFSEWRQPCAEERRAETPADFIRRGFEARVRGGKIVRPAPLNCVIGLFSRAELQDYAEADDPAAALALIYLDFVESKDTCGALRRHEAELLQIADAPYEPPEGHAVGYRISLLPDALLVVAEARGVCGGDEDQAYVQAWEKGLDIQTINGGVVRPH